MAPIAFATGIWATGDASTRSGARPGVTVRRICLTAKVPLVTPHGLRGTGATHDLLRALVAGVSQKRGHTGNTRPSRPAEPIS